ncbi:hypothetical protein N8Z24_00240 [bacterium]|nr:hypothetical protein [bacterium]
MEKEIMTNKNEERILVMDSNLVNGFHGFDFINNGGNDSMGLDLRAHGVSLDPRDFVWFDECIKRSYFMPRGAVEDDINYKQLIPYIVVRSESLIFAYQRDGNENRLTGQYSIGVGGHTNVDDFGLSGFEGILKNSANRELSEELSFGKTPFSFTTDLRINSGLSLPTAFLYSGNSEAIVDHVHFGIVYVINLPPDEIQDVSLKEEGKMLDWMTKEDLYGVYDNLEEWSKLVLDKCL